MLGWNKDSVKNYGALQKICSEAWDIVRTTFEKSVPISQGTSVLDQGTGVLFSENLLRSILKLTPEQQKELVTEFATNKDFSKGKFKSLAENYQSRNEMYKLAIQSNEASGAVVPMTMVSYAEFIWARLAEKDERDKKKYTQLDVANMLGWTDSAVSNYALLDKIDKQAWEIISTTFENPAHSRKDEAVDESSTMVGSSDVIFTERLLRSTLNLTSEQQLELVKERAKDPKTFTPGKFKTRAENYQTRNEAKAYALEKLGNLGEPYTTKTLISYILCNIATRQDNSTAKQLVSSASISL